MTPQQLRERSWWSGPELYVIVDDYDLVATSMGNPVSALLEHLPHARDLGFHLIVARRAGGASRAMYESTMARMKDLGSAGLIMSCPKDEGVLMGTVRPSPLPPGRGTYITRNAQELIQLAWMPAAE
ncbi:cell division protein FtsK [Mycobacteroides abscessus subsp. abscessus]|nr:cell division protein FtsK [Mycobacteroides abscessus subsp. abscessus]